MMRIISVLSAFCCDASKPGHRKCKPGIKTLSHEAHWHGLKHKADCYQRSCEETENGDYNNSRERYIFKTAGIANKTHKCLPENLKHVRAASLLSNPKLCQWAELSLSWRHVNASCLFIYLSVRH